MNIRLRTTAAGASTTNSVAQWDFAMTSIQWVDTTAIPSLTFNLSDNNVGFGNASAVTARYATDDAVGTTTSSAIAHALSVSTNAVGGYVVAIDGTEPLCLTSCSGASIDAVGPIATTTNVGTEQFGLNLSTTVGAGVVSSPYNTVNWAYGTSTFPATVATGAGDDTTSTFAVRYMTNISALTESGDYAAVVTYRVTGTF